MFRVYGTSGSKKQMLESICSVPRDELESTLEPFIKHSEAWANPIKTVNTHSWEKRVFWKMWNLDKQLWIPKSRISDKNQFPSPIRMNSLNQLQMPEDECVSMENEMNSSLNNFLHSHYFDNTKRLSTQVPSSQTQDIIDSATKRWKRIVSDKNSKLNGDWPLEWTPIK